MPKSHPTLRRRVPSAKVPSTRLILTNKMLTGTKGDNNDDNGSGELTRKSRALEGAPVTESEADAILLQLTHRDDNKQKTWSRMLVENYLSKVRTAMMKCNEGSFLVQESKVMQML